MANITQVQNNLKYKQAKGSLIAIIIFSFLNLFLLTFTDIYLLFSSYITQLFGLMAWVAFDEGVISLTIVFILIGIVSVVPYLLFYIFEKKHIGFMIAALVLFSIDTLLLLIFGISAIISDGAVDVIIDIAFHAYAIYALASAVVYGIKAKKSNAEAASAENTVNDTVSAELTLESRKVTVEREKRFVGCAAIFICYIDGNQVATIRNGETIDIGIDGNQHEFAVMIGNTGRAAAIQIRPGLGTVNIKVSAKSTFSGVNPIILEN